MRADPVPKTVRHWHLTCQTCGRQWGVDTIGVDKPSTKHFVKEKGERRACGGYVAIKEQNA